MTTQITLDLPDQLYERARQRAVAHRQAMAESIIQILDEALDAGEDEGQILDWTEPDEALEREMQAFIAMHPELKERYWGQHVAIYGGKLVDHDADYGPLYERIEQTYPDQFVWLARVEEDPLPTIVVRSPRWVEDDKYTAA